MLVLHLSVGQEAGSVPGTHSWEGLQVEHPVKGQKEGHCDSHVCAMSPTQNWDGWFDTEFLQLLSPQCENLSVPTGSASRSSSCCISWLPMFLTTHPPGWWRG